MNQEVELMQHLQTEVWDLLSFSLFLIACIFMQHTLWKATFRKQVKEIWYLFLLSSLFCLNENPKVRFAMTYFLWIMKCNLREQMPNQVSFWNKSQCFLWTTSRPKLSSHNPWSAGLKTYKLFFEFFFGHLYRIYRIFWCAHYISAYVCVMVKRCIKSLCHYFPYRVNVKCESSVKFVVQSIHPSVAACFLSNETVTPSRGQF